VVIDPHIFAPWVSPEAKAAFAFPQPAPPAGADLATLRAHYGEFNQRMLDKALAAYHVKIAEDEIAGVGVDRVIPAGGATDPRLLICLHGGAFMWGAGAGALLEAVPLAATMRCEVIAVDYRLAPEHSYPAAVDDALAVYRDALNSRQGTSIGIYGCSAGGALTAQSVAALIASGDPLPGAVAMLHGTGLPFAGDSALTAGLFNPRGESAEAPTAEALPYFATANLTDPLVMPGEHPSVLAHFPPSLLVSGTRDFAASACATMHRRLLAAGAEAQFVLFDGVGHAHHMDVALPEARETFGLMARFFDEHLR
jgi:acetyl esterase/lipase